MCKAYRRQLKLDVIAAYGGQCECCGETRWEFLTLDHKEGRAPGERELGDTMYRKARDEGYPSRYRILCYNCNCSLGHLRYCPHAA